MSGTPAGVAMSALSEKICSHNTGIIQLPMSFWAETMM